MGTADEDIIPFDEREGVIWKDGGLVPWREARLHVLSHGLHYGSCVFEGERVYGGRIFASRAHSRRLIESGRMLDMEIPADLEALERIKYETVDAAGLTEGYVRAVAWRGSEMMAVSAQQTRIHLAVACWPWPSYFPPDEKMKGIRLKTADWRRPPPACAPVHAKAAGLYMICTLAKHQVEREGYHDALMLDWKGRVAEATGANIFLVREGVLHTPVPDCFLDGITRRTVIELARARDMEVVERDIEPGELGDFEEAFLTGTAAEVTPIGRIDSVTYAPGTICETLMAAYSAHVRADPRKDAQGRIIAA